MGVDRERVPAAAVLQEVAGHPVILVRSGDVLDDFAVVAAVELGAALTRRADVAGREPLVEI
jgi:hypothetical protein